MLNLFKKREYANVIVFNSKPFFSDYTIVINTIHQYFNDEYRLSLNNIIYCDNDNRDIQGKINQFKKINSDNVSLLQMTVDSDADNEKELSIGFSRFEGGVSFHCMLNQKFKIDFQKLYSAINLGANLNFGFLYEIVIRNGIPDFYLLNSQESNKNVIGLPPERISSEMMWCHRQNKRQLFEGIMKDIYKHNLITNKHLAKIEHSELYFFLKENNLIKENSPGVYYFGLEQDSMLNYARKLAYSEKLVLCS